MRILLDGPLDSAGISASLEKHFCAAFSMPAAMVDTGVNAICFVCITCSSYCLLFIFLGMRLVGFG